MDLPQEHRCKRVDSSLILQGLMSHQRTSTEEHVFSAKFGVWMIMASGMQLRQESLRAETLKLLGEGEPPQIDVGKE